MNDIRTTPMPAPPSPWVFIGPAILLLGMSQGSGELWLLPKLHAEHGLDFTWVILYGTLFQIPLLVEAMRVTALTGEGPLSVVARYSKVAAVICLALTVLAMIGAAGFILTVGESIWRLIGWPVGSGDSPKRLWALLFALLVAIPVLRRRANLQRYMELVVGACSLTAIVLFIAALALRPEVFRQVPDFLSALFIPRNLGADLAGADRTTLAVGFTYMGLGGWYCLFYPLWGRNRRVGVAGTRSDESHELHVAASTADDERHTRQWNRNIWLATAAALGANAITVMLTSLLALGLLHGRGVTIGSNWDLLLRQSAFFEPVLGGAAAVVFLVAVVAFFSDTWLGTYVSLAQLLTDTTRSLTTRARGMSRMRLFYIVFGFVFLLSLVPIIGPLSPGALLLKWMGVMMFCSMPIICIMLLIINYRILPRIGPSFYRPSPLAMGALLISTIVYSGATVLYLASTL
jgi:hypothetical protein